MTEANQIQANAPCFAFRKAGGVVYTVKLFFSEVSLLKSLRK